MTHHGSAHTRPRTTRPRSCPPEQPAEHLVAVLEGARGRMSRLLELLGDPGAASSR